MRTWTDYFDGNMDKVNPKQRADHSADSLHFTSYSLQPEVRLSVTGLRGPRTFNHDNQLTVTPGIILRLYTIASTALGLCSHLSKIPHHNLAQSNPSSTIHPSIICLTSKLILVQFKMLVFFPTFSVRLSNTGEQVHER